MKIVDPIIGSIVRHTGWGQDGDKYPCDVYIVSGCYLDSTYGRVSNFWYWRRVLPDGTLLEAECGYGSFEESEKKYDIRIVCKNVSQ